MSLLSRFNGKKSRDIDDLRNDIIENLSGILSSRAPILMERISENSVANGTILTLGLTNTTRFQKKYNGKFIFEEILELIKKYEPRLQEVELEQTDTNKDLNFFEFKIKGTIQFGDSEDNVLFDSCLDFGTNKFKVRKINFV